MDKLQIVNRALVATGNRPVTLNDGGDEWVAAETLWGRVIEDLISSYRWPFARKSAILVATTPVHGRTWPYAYALPTDLLHLVRVFQGFYPSGVFPTGATTFPTDYYQVFGRQLGMNATGDVSIEYIAEPEDTAWHPQTVEVLTLRMEQEFLKSLNEDHNEAARRGVDVRDKMAVARAQIAAENPAGPAQVGAASIARRRRRA